MKITLLLFSLAAILAGIYTVGYNKGYEDAQDYVQTFRLEREFWRAMYLQADADAKAVNCEPLDNNYFICEKARTP